jgi:triacylglycerol lipase
VVPNGPEDGPVSSSGRVRPGALAGSRAPHTVAAMGGPRSWLPAGRMAGWLRGLPPAKRALAAGIALLVAVAGVSAAAAAVRGGSASPSAAGPSASSGPGAGGRGGAGPPGSTPGGSGPDPRYRPRYPAQDRPGPVLLVPGYGGNSSDLSVLASRISSTGRTAIVVQLPGRGTGDLTADARVLNHAVIRALRHGAPSVDVIGYSAGGVVALIWARDDGGALKARRVITLGSPFHGTTVAALARDFVPRLCPMACRQLVPGSGLLARLDAAPRPSRPPWLSLWTTDDLVVTPPASARLPGALDVPVQSVCPGRQISHEQLPVDPVVVAIVLRAIGRGPLRYPADASCAG